MQDASPTEGALVDCLEIHLQRECLESIVKGKRISCRPRYHYRDPAKERGGRLRQRHGFERGGLPLIRSSLRASAQRSTSVLFSFVLSLLIVAGLFAIWQSKTILAPFSEASRWLHRLVRWFHSPLIDRMNPGMSSSRFYRIRKSR